MMVMMTHNDDVHDCTVYDNDDDISRNFKEISFKNFRVYIGHCWRHCRLVIPIAFKIISQIFDNYLYQL